MVSKYELGYYGSLVSLQCDGVCGCCFFCHFPQYESGKEVEEESLKLWN